MRARESLDKGELPALQLLEGVILIFGGALLLTPGFVTDAIGFACLVPALRQALVRQVISRGNWVRVDTPVETGPRGGRVIDGEFRRED